MKQLLFGIIGLAILQSVCGLLIEEKNQKFILRFVCGLATVTLLLGCLTSFDFETYASSLREHTQFSGVPETARSDGERLNRMFIENECAAYILNKAASMKAPLSDAAVSLSWNTNGYWYPSGVELTIPCGSERDSALADMITTDLGIPLSSQIWREEGADEP